MKVLHVIALFMFTFLTSVSLYGDCNDGYAYCKNGNRVTWGCCARPLCSVCALDYETQADSKCWAQKLCKDQNSDLDTNRPFQKCGGEIAALTNYPNCPTYSLH